MRPGDIVYVQRCRDNVVETEIRRLVYGGQPLKFLRLTKGGLALCQEGNGQQHSLPSWSLGRQPDPVSAGGGDRYEAEETGMKSNGVPYEAATSGGAARDEITKILRRFGCESVGFMDDFSEKTVLLAFTHRGRPIQLKASANGWAQMYLKAHPYSSRTRCTPQQYQERALKQGLIAVNSILRDWVKGQITAVECGMLDFEAVFLPYMLTSDGRPLIERLKETKLLPMPS